MIRRSLIAGDVVAFLAFSALGRAEHETGLAPWAIVATAFPFILPWLGVGVWLGAFKERAVASPKAAFKKAALAWTLTLPLAMQLRALIVRRSMPLTFVIVTYVVVFALLVGWRTVYAWRKTRKEKGGPRP